MKKKRTEKFMNMRITTVSFLQKMFFRLHDAGISFLGDNLDILRKLIHIHYVI